MVKIGILTMLLFTFAIGQTLQKDLQMIIQKHPADLKYNIKKETSPTPIDVANASEVKLLFANFIRSYQVAISSQDLPTCNFHPSCSRFGSMVVQKAGTIKGILLASDRLQRCNGLPGGNFPYSFLPQFGKFADPVEDYISIEQSTHGSE